MTFRILTVCTGNVCRSPLAELMLASALESASPVTVRSAGVGALVGEGVPEPARALATANGLDASAHVAQQMTGTMLGDADLILGMARDHRRHVVQALPASVRRAFTLRELARIADVVEPELPRAVEDAGASTPEDAMRAAVALAHVMRGSVEPPAVPDDLDVVDPYRRSDDTYRRSFSQLAPAAQRVAAYLLSAARSVAPA